jgi:undecaprenyl-diphosphatase
MDTSLLHAVNDLFARHDGILEDPVLAYTNASLKLFLGMLVIAFVVVAGRHRRGVQRAVVAAGLSAGLALAIAQVISRLVDRPRPFVAHPDTVHLFAHHVADAGFPSDHTTAAFAIAVALLLRFRVWGAVVLAFAIVLAIGRVGLAVHYPTDVVAGAALGTVSALALWTQPARDLLQRLADIAAGILDGGLRGVASRVRPAA